MIELIIKFIGSLGVVIAAYKLLVELGTGKLSRYREDYRFAKEFFKDLDAKSPDSSLHPLVERKGYVALVGVEDVPPATIAYLLKLEDPDLAIRRFRQGRPYLNYNTGDHLKPIRLKDKRWFGPIGRKVRKVFYASSYFALAMLAFLPFIFASYVIRPDAASIVGWLIYLFVFLSVAIMLLRQGVKISTAEKLVDSLPALALA